MSIIHRIAYYLNRRDEVPNQELARELAERNDRSGIQEIAENLWNKNPQVQSDCLKVLYEVGYIKPDLISSFVEDFLQLVSHRNNRLVWGSMLALSTIAGLRAEEIFAQRGQIMKAIEHGSVITRDNGIKTLASVASKREDYRDEILPFLFLHLASCRPKDVPQHAESILVAINTKHSGEFSHILAARIPDLKPSELKRIQRVIRNLTQAQSGTPL